MFALRAVKPDWFGVLDFECKCWHRLSVLGYRHEAREETNGAISCWGVSDWNTWVGKGSLDDRVIHWVELKLNEITNVGLDFGWHKNRRSIGSHGLDDMDFNGF